MNTEMKKIGELFEAKRREKSLSLKDVENATSIRSSYLEAIEKGEVEKFLSTVYFLGFIRQYATYLEIDVETLMKQHPELFQRKEEKHDFAYGIGTLEMRGSMGGGVKWLPNLLYGGAFVVLLIAAYYFAKFVGVL